MYFRAGRLISPFIDLSWLFLGGWPRSQISNDRFILLIKLYSEWLDPPSPCTLFQDHEKDAMLCWETAPCGLARLDQL